MYQPCPVLLRSLRGGGEDTHLFTFPEFPIASYVFGVPDVTLKFVRGTTALEVYAPPVHFWQSVQWQRAVTAGSPVNSSTFVRITF